MPSARFSVHELLAAVEEHYTVTEIWGALGGLGRCVRSTVWRALGRAWARGLVACFERDDFHIWELAGPGRICLEAYQPAPTRRPTCPQCGVAAGSRLSKPEGRWDYTVLVTGGLRCRGCKHSYWKGLPAELEAAEYFDRRASRARDIYAMALRSGFSEPPPQPSPAPTSPRRKRRSPRGLDSRQLSLLEDGP